MKAASASAVGNDSDSGGFIEFVLLVCPLSIDVGTMVGDRIDPFWGVLTDLPVPMSLVRSNSSDTGSRAGSAFCTVRRRVF